MAILGVVHGNGGRERERMDWDGIASYPRVAFLLCNEGNNITNTKCHRGFQDQEMVSALIETKRLKIACDHGLLDDLDATVPMKIWWLLPQYLSNYWLRNFKSLLIVFPR
uniref:Uncharacterized protein n=1 Tax=Lactuca sativa TaxID=4236 RepID=A0A9R1XXR4_LACSA|nr:hypothetical protein LSAT_V11C100010830 [Lactuca sativa]